MLRMICTEDDSTGFAQLTANETLALAKLAKQMTWGQLRLFAASDTEAHAMSAALSALRAALADTGYEPR